MKPIFARLFLLSLAGGILATSTFGAVTVKRQDPVVTKQVFDPKRPSPKMPKLNPPESGICDFDFEIDTGLSYSVGAAGPGTLEIVVDEIDIVTGLSVRIWTARGSPPKLLAHEEGHRQLCEYYYQNADFIAREVAEPVIGRSFIGKGANREAAQADAVQQALKAVSEEYMIRTRVRNSAAQRRYDRITQHGLKSIAESEAIAQAVKEDPEPSRESRMAQAAATEAARPAEAAVAPVQEFWKWNDLVNRPERWPLEVRLARQIAFQDGTKFPKNSVVRVTKVTSRGLEVILPDGATAAFEQGDTDLLVAANRYWGTLTEDQRAVDYSAIIRDPSLHPATVTSFVGLNFAKGSMPAGSEVPLFDIVNNRPQVWSSSDNRPMILDFADTDLLARAREIARIPATERPNRIASLLEDATFDTDGKPVTLDAKPIYVFYRASTTCGNSQAYTSRFAERMKAILAKHDNVALVSLAYDNTDQEALSFARGFDLPGVVVPASKRPPQLEKFNVQVMPGIIVIDRNGRELFANKRYTGAAGHDALLARLETELARTASR